MRDASLYIRCVEQAPQIALKRDGTGGEAAAAAIVGECRFAEWAGISPAPIRAAAMESPVFRYGDRVRVLVCTAVFDPDAASRRVTLFVPEHDVRQHRAHLYVLWSVNWKTGSNHGVGWTTFDDVQRSPVGQVTRTASYGCHIVQQSRLRSMRDLDDWVSGLRQSVGKDAVLDWWITKKQAAVRIGETAVGIVYRGAQGWHATGLDEIYATPEDAARAALTKPIDAGPCKWPW